MARRLLQLLDGTPEAPLSFVVFVPDWEGADYCNLLDGPEAAAHRRCHGGPFVLARGQEHHYISGVQFFADKGDDARQRYYVVPHGTRVYVLQTDAGARKWPFTPELQAALLEQMKPL